MALLAFLLHQGEGEGSLRQRLRGPRGMSLTALVLLLLLASCASAQSNHGCYWYCCGGYSCGCGSCSCGCGSCYCDWWQSCCYNCCCCSGCTYFDSTASSFAFWSGCSGRVMYVNSGVTAQMRDGSNTRVDLQGSSATISIYNGAYVTQVRSLASSTSLTVRSGGGVGTYNGNGNTGNVYVYGYITDINGGSAGGGTVTIYSGGSSSNIDWYSGTVNVIGSATNIYPHGSTVYVSGSASLISGHGTISVSGSVSTVRITASSSVTVSGTVSTLSLTGGTTSVTATGTINTIRVSTSGNTFTFTGGRFDTLTYTSAQSSGSVAASGSSTLGCIVYQSTASGVTLTFSGSSFTSSSCHFVHFQSTVTSSTLTVSGASTHTITGYSAVYGASTFNNVFITWDNSKLYTISSNGYYASSVIGSGLTFSVASCSGGRAMTIGSDAFSIGNGNSAGSFVKFLISSSYITAASDIVTFGDAANSITLTATSSTLYSTHRTMIFANTVSTLYVNSLSSTVSSSSTQLLYAGTSIASATVTVQASTWTAASQGLYCGSGGVSSSKFLITSSATWNAANQGFYSVGSISNTDITVIASSLWSTGSQGLYCGDSVLSCSLTISSSSTWTTASSFGFQVVSAVNAMNMLVRATSSMVSPSHSMSIGGRATSLTVTITSTGADNVRVTSSASNFVILGGATSVTLSVLGSLALLSAPGMNLYVDGGNSNNVHMHVTSAATVTAGNRNWEFSGTAPLTTTGNVISISGTSLVRAASTNFKFGSTASIAISVIGTTGSPSTLQADAVANVWVVGDAAYLRMTVTSSGMTAGTNNIEVEGAVGTVTTPNEIYLSSSTISAASTGMIFTGGQNVLTITASGSTTWNAGGVGAISMSGYATSGAISILSSSVTVATTDVAPAIVQFNSGTAYTMTSQRVFMDAVNYLYTQSAGSPTPTYVSFIRTMNTNMLNPVVTIFGSSFVVQAPQTHRMELLDFQGQTRITGATVLLSKIPYTSNSLSCSTLPKGYGPCDSLMRGAILMASNTGTVATSTITVQCIEFSTTTLSFMDFQGAVSDTFIRSDSVAIWQSQAIIAFVNFDNVASSNNVVWIVFTYLHVPIIVHSENGAPTIASIASNCSFMSVYPMAEGFFEPALIPLVVRPQLWTCSKTYHPSCWITKSFSLSLSLTMTLTSTLSLSDEPTKTKTLTLTITKSAERSGTVSLSDQRSDSLTVLPTVSQRPTATRSLVGTASQTFELTVTVARGQHANRASTSVTTSLSLHVSSSATPTLSQVLSDSVTPSATTSVSPSASATPSQQLSMSPRSVTQSMSATPSTTISDEPTATSSPTSSVTPTLSAGTPSSTQSNPPTQTTSISWSTTPSSSMSRELSETPSTSASFSEEQSRSETPSQTVSEQPTPTRSPTGSSSPSASMSPTDTLSPTATVSPTDSASPSTTVSLSPSASQEISLTRSLTLSASNEQTRTLDTASLTAEASKTESATGIESASRSPSTSLSPTASRTVTETDTPSWSATPTGATLTVNPSTTESSSGSASVTPSSTSTATASPDGPTTTETVSVTREPTLEETLSETETFSATDTWSITGLTPTRIVTRSRTKRTRSDEVSATPSETSSGASATTEVSVEESRSDSFSQHLSRSETPSSDGATSSPTDSSSMSAEPPTPSPSAELSGTSSRTVHRNSRTSIETATMTMTEGRTMTASVSATPLRKTRSAQLSETPSATAAGLSRSPTSSASGSRDHNAVHSHTVGAAGSDTRTVRLSTESSISRTEGSSSASATIALVRGAPGAEGNITVAPEQTESTTPSMNSHTASDHRVSQSRDGKGLSATRHPPSSSQSQTVTLMYSEMAGQGRAATPSLSASGALSVSEPSATHKTTGSMSLSADAASFTMTRLRTRSLRRRTEQGSASVTSTTTHTAGTQSAELTRTLTTSLSSSVSRGTRSNSASNEARSSSVTWQLPLTLTNTTLATATRRPTHSLSSALSTTETWTRSVASPTHTVRAKQWVWLPGSNATKSRTSANDGGEWVAVGGPSVSPTVTLTASLSNSAPPSESQWRLSITKSETATTTVTNSPTGSPRPPSATHTVHIVTATATGRQGGGWGPNDGNNAGGDRYGHTASLTTTVTVTTTHELTDTVGTKTMSLSSSSSIAPSRSRTPEVTATGHVTPSQPTPSVSGPPATATRTWAATDSNPTLTATARLGGEQPTVVGDNAALSASTLFQFDNRFKLSSGASLVIGANIAVLSCAVVARVLFFLGLRSEPSRGSGGGEFGSEEDDEGTPLPTPRVERTFKQRFLSRHAYTGVLLACTQFCSVVHSATGWLHLNVLFTICVIVSAAMGGGDGVDGSALAVNGSVVVRALIASACAVMVRAFVDLTSLRCCHANNSSTGEPTVGRRDGASNKQHLLAAGAAVGTPPITHGHNNSNESSNSDDGATRSSGRLPPMHSPTAPQLKFELPFKNDETAVRTMDSRPSSGGVRSLADLFGEDDVPSLPGASSRPSSNRQSNATARRFTVASAVVDSGELATVDDGDLDVIDLDAMSMLPMEPPRYTEFESSHGSRNSSIRSMVLNSAAPVPAAAARHAPSRPSLTSLGDGATSAAGDESDNFGSISIPDDMVFTGDIDVGSVDMGSTSSSSGASWGMSHLGQQGTRGLRGGGRGGVQDGAALHGQPQHATSLPAGATVADATTGRLMWVPPTAAEAHAQEGAAAVSEDDEDDDVDRWFKRPKPTKAAMEAEEDDFYFFTDGIDEAVEGPQKEHLPSQRPTTAMMGIGVPPSHRMASSDYISAFFEDDDDLLNGDAVATEPHNNKKNISDAKASAPRNKTVPDRSAAYALPSGAAAAAASVGQQQVNNPNLSDLSASLEDDDQGSSGGVTAPPPTAHNNNNHDRFWTYERRMALLWASVSVVLLVVLVFGVKPFDASTSGIVLVSLVVDVLLVQTAYAAAMTYYSIAVVAASSGAAVAAAAAFASSPEGSAASSSDSSGLKKPKKSETGGQSQPTQHQRQRHSGAAAQSSSTKKHHTNFPLVPPVSGGKQRGGGK